MKQSFANIFGALGYISLLMQWVWMGVVVGTPIIASDAFKNLFLPEQTTPTTRTISMDIPEPIGVIFMVLAVLFAVGVSVYAVIAVPRSIARTGHKITSKSAQVIVPHVTHHKHISKKREKTLFERITWTVKLVALLIPVAALVVRPAEMIGLSHGVVVGVGLFCAGATLVWFGLQYATAKLSKLDPSRVW